MFQGTDSHLHMHRCFPHYKSLIDCVDGNIFKRKVCSPYMIDFLECNNKLKMVASG